MGLIKSFSNLFSPRIKVPASPDGRPHPLDQVILPQARDRWLTTSVKSYTPDQIESTLRGAFGGNLLAQWQLFDLMEETWPHLAKNLNELKRSVRSMELSVTPFAETGKKPTPAAEEKARLVEKALRGMQPQPGTDQNDWGGTIYDLLDAWGKGISVLEMDWRQGASPNGGTQQSEISLRSTRWIHPRYYGYSSFSSDLLLNVYQVNSKLDPILQQPSAPEMQIYDLEPVVDGNFAPFPENKFLISICKQKSGHAIGGALLRTLAWWWCASNFTTEWFLNYAQLFGQPFRWAEYDVNKPGLLNTISAMMENMGSSGWGAFPAGTKLEFKEAAKGAGDNPHAFLIRFADKLCDILILGQTLSTDVGDGGSGSRALGQVHEGIRGDILEAAGDYIAGILNAQFVPAICKLNYGDQVDELPSVLLANKEVTDAKALAERDQILLSIPGVTIPKKWFLQRHDIPVAQDGEDVIEGQARASAPGASPEGPGEQESAVQAKEVSDIADQIMEEFTGVEKKWLGGIKPKFQELVIMAKSGEVSDKEFIAALEHTIRVFPEFGQHLDGKALANAMEARMGTACVNGAIRGYLNRGGGKRRKEVA